MLEIHFEINGRRVDPRSLGETLEAAALESVRDAVTAKLGAVRCSVHGQSPSVLCHGRSLGTLSFTVSGCCQELIDQATKRLT